MSEPTAEEQAQMALRLADSVQDLIRAEITKALKDNIFRDDIRHDLQTTVFNNAEWNHEFKIAIKSFLQTQLSKG